VPAFVYSFLPHAANTAFSRLYDVWAHLSGGSLSLTFSTVDFDGQVGPTSLIYLCSIVLGLGLLIGKRDGAVPAVMQQ
jgi:hypothetical protein